VVLRRTKNDLRDVQLTKSVKGRVALTRGTITPLLRNGPFIARSKNRSQDPDDLLIGSIIKHVETLHDATTRRTFLERSLLLERLSGSSGVGRPSNGRRTNVIPDAGSAGLGGYNLPIWHAVSRG